MRGLIKRTPECALHVHVASAGSAEAAVAAMNGLREALPLLRALGANSPFWFGVDSGWRAPASAVIRAYPGPRHPAAAAQWDDYLERSTRSSRRRRPEGPHDGLVGRAAAAAAGHRRAARAGRADRPRVRPPAIAALVHAIVRRAVEDAASPSRRPAQALHWSSFRAVRDGLDAELLLRGDLQAAARGGRELLAELAARDARAGGRGAHPARRRGARPAARDQ